MILMYHKVHPNSPTMWWVFVNDFYRQMAELSNKEVVFLDDYNHTNTNHVVITFDGIYKNVVEYALPILKHFNYPFELFLTSDYIGLDNEFDAVEPNSPFANENELLELINGGGRLQWHTRSHLNLKEIIDLNIIANELTIPENIKKIDTKGFKWFAYPHGEHNDVVLEEVKKRFYGALTCNQGNDFDKYVYNRTTVVNKTIFRENKIVCILASYNYGAYLIEAIESILRQTILPNEILITDDCSDDETQIIAETYVKKYPHLISYNRNETNMGIVDHFNKAVSLTKSEYIMFLGADNRLLSNYIEESAKVLDEHEKIAIAYTDYAFFGSRAKITYQTLDEERKGEIKNDFFYQVHFPEFNNHDELKTALQNGNFIHGSSMFKRKSYQDVGGYLKSDNAEDYNLFKRIVEFGWDSKKVKTTNLEYRQHSLGQANNILSIQNRMLFYKESYEVLLKNKNSFENSLLYKISSKIYRIHIFLKRNYKNLKAFF